MKYQALLAQQYVEENYYNTTTDVTVTSTFKIHSNSEAYASRSPSKNMCATWVTKSARAMRACTICIYDACMCDAWMFVCTYNAMRACAICACRMCGRATRGRTIRVCRAMNAYATRLAATCDARVFDAHAWPPAHELTCARARLRLSLPAHEATFA
eukprot:4935494-Pleurochrysis_carterae.AAC.4